MYMKKTRRMDWKAALGRSLEMCQYTDEVRMLQFPHFYEDPQQNSSGGGYSLVEITGKKDRAF